MKMLKKIYKSIIIVFKKIGKLAFNVLKFLLWFILAPIDMLIMILYPIAKYHKPNTIKQKFISKYYYPDSKIHKWIYGYYNASVKPALTKNISSRASFTFAHGLLHSFIFTIVLIFVTLSSWHILNNKSSIVKNKYISVSTYSKTHHKFNGLYFMWSQDWNVDGEKLDRSFSMKFYPDEPAEGDTAHYAVCVKANFDLKLDSSACFKNADNINYKVLSFSENEIMVEMYRSHFKDFNELLNSFNVDIIGHAKVFDDDDTPYVNFFIGFDDQALVIDPSKQSSDIRIFFNSEYMDGFANMPYDIQMVKPEPASNCPWHLFYGVYRKDSINVVNEVQDVVDHGLYISTVNRELKQKKDRESFFYSILIGALVSFLFSILINLFIKWRNLNQSEGNSDPFSSTNTKKE